MGRIENSISIPPLYSFSHTHVLATDTAAKKNGILTPSFEMYSLSSISCIFEHNFNLPFEWLIRNAARNLRRELCSNLGHKFLESLERNIFKYSQCVRIQGVRTVRNLKSRSCLHGSKRPCFSSNAWKQCRSCYSLAVKLAGCTICTRWCVTLWAIKWRKACCSCPSFSITTKWCFSQLILAPNWKL